MKWFEHRAGSGPASYYPLMLGIIAAALGGKIVYNCALNLFYTFGAVIWDRAQFATNIWRSGWLLQEPRLFDQGASPPGPISYFTYHIAPILYIPNSFSYLFAGDRVTYFALVSALLYAAIVFTVYRHLLSVSWGSRAPWFAFACTVLLFFSWHLANTVWEARPDYASIPLMLLALRAWQQQRYRRSLLWLMGNASIHEGIALFYAPAFALLVASQTLPRLKTDPGARRRLKWGIILILVPLAYSAAAYLGQKIFFPGFDTVGEMYYSSDAPFAHLTADILKDRLSFIYHNQSSLWLPFLLVLLYGIIARDLEVLAGTLGFLPYLLAMIGSKVDFFGKLQVYKSFPLMIALLWPSIIAMAKPVSLRRPLLMLQAAALTCSLSYVYQNPYFIETLSQWARRQPPSYNAGLYDAFGKNDLGSEQPSRPNVRASQGILSLYPYQFPPYDSSWIGKAGEPVDTLIWFQGDYDASIVNNVLGSGNFIITEIPGTQIRIAHKAGSSIMRIAP